MSTRILLTGASGLLGKALLASAPRACITALWHRTELSVDALREGAELRPLRGDLRQRLLGLSAEDYAQLCADTDVIVHSAAVTKFTADPDELRDTNIEGTRNIVQFARDSGARLIYVSTAFTLESVSALPPASGYEDSKREAERLVGELPDATIIRPSIIVGDSHTGRVGAYQGWHQIMGMLMIGALPVVPSVAGRLCDLVAQDWVADTVWGAALHPRTFGELWVTSGENALPVEEVVDIAPRLGKRYGFNPPPIKLIPYETIERLFMPVFLKTLPPQLLRIVEPNLKLARYMNGMHAFPSTEALHQREFGLGPRQPLLRVLERNMECWVEDHLRRRAAKAQAALAGSAQDAT